jgi:hypothetical protein
MNVYNGTKEGKTKRKEKKDLLQQIKTWNRSKTSTSQQQN